MPKSRIKPAPVDLSAWSHIKIGSKCSDFYLPESNEQLLEVFDIAQKQNKKLLLLAGGSNILFGDTAEYLVVSDANLPRYWKQIDNEIIVSANYNISQLVMKMLYKNLGGLEFLCSVPAHIAGLVKMNAGAFGSQISQYVKHITVLDKKGIRIKSREELYFNYRYSNICEYITEVCLTPDIISQEETLKKIKSYIQNRRRKMPINLPNLGCIFKNPTDISAGYLLDKAGMKGKRIGDAAFSALHANVMVNLGKASFSDAMALITEAQDAVRKGFNLELELEIKVVNR